MVGTGNIMAFGVGSMCLGATFLLTLLFALMGRNGGLEGRIEGCLGTFVCLIGFSLTAVFFAVALL